nr:hypothetical protein [Nannocystis sp.]
MECPKKQGALWIHVTDDIGQNLPGVMARKNQDDPTPTNSVGLVVFDPLGAASYTATITDLVEPFVKSHEPPKEVSKVVPVSDGVISYVSFMLPRKATLIVEIFQRPDPSKPSASKPFKELGIRVTSDRGPSMPATDGVADFGAISPQKHTITVAFIDGDQNLFDFFGPTERTIELEPGKAGKLSFEVEPLYKTVRFIAHCLLTIPKQIWQEEELKKDVAVYFPEDENPDDFEALRTENRDETFGGADATLRSKYWKVEYTGLDVAADIKRRVEFLASVIRQAAGKIEEKDDELKIFMVPECFFLGRDGAYPVEDLALLVNELQKLVMAADWRHWLFVFGTVNTVFSDDQERFVEFTNFSPVVRGGALAEAKLPDYTRMIQKAKFCAELAGDTDLLPTAPVGTLTSEKVRSGFGATENEFILGQIILELLVDQEPAIDGEAIARVFENGGLTALHWTELKAAVKRAVADPNFTITSVVRDIRDYPDTGIKDLAQLEFCGYFMPAKNFIVNSWQQVTKAFLNTILKKTAIWKKNANKAALKKALEDVILELRKPQELLKGLDFQIAALELRIRGVIDDIELNDVLSGRFADIWNVSSRDIQAKMVWHLSWVPLFRELLKLYLEERGLWRQDVKEETVLGPKLGKNFSLADYVFSCGRKPGPLIDKEVVPETRKLTFGLEICADHSEGRLQNALTQAAVKPTFDIQLIPSAGMVIHDARIVTRAGGLVFNCDGWNAAGAMLGMLLKRNGAKREHTVNEWPKDVGKNPLRPHSEVVKKTGPGSSPVLPAEIVIIADDVKDLFPLDAGELHIYPSQDLP